MANPAIPCSHLLLRRDAAFERLPHISFLTPVLDRERVVGADGAQEPTIVGFRVFQQIRRICSEKIEGQGIHIVVGGESYFPFDVSEDPRLVSLWQSALGPNDILFMGCCVAGRQAVVGLQKDLIIGYYVKKWLMPFVECEPSWWTKIWGKNVKKGNCALFGGALFTTACDPSLSSIDAFSIGNFILTPALCGEFFLFSMKSSGGQDKNVLHTIFVNDSWFDTFFKERLADLAILKAWWNKKQILYVGHDKFFIC